MLARARSEAPAACQGHCRGAKAGGRDGEQVINRSMEMRLFRNARRVWETGLDGKKNVWKRDMVKCAKMHTLSF